MCPLRCWFLELADYLRVLPVVRRLVSGVDRAVRSIATVASAGAGRVAGTLSHMRKELTRETLDSWTAVITHHVSHRLDVVQSGEGF